LPYKVLRQKVFRLVLLNVRRLLISPYIFIHIFFFADGAVWIRFEVPICFRILNLLGPGLLNFKGVI